MSSRTTAAPTAEAGNPPVRPGRPAGLGFCRRFGTAGAALMAVGALGAGAAPVQNPLPGLLLLGLPSRALNSAIALTYVGIFMVIMAWLWMGRLVHPGRADQPSRGELDRTMLLWSFPLALVPPLFSRDVYSYLAVGKIAGLGMDPFTLGPAQALGVDDPMTLNVPTVWRDTPTPYGPVSVLLGQLVVAVTGNNVLLGVLLTRLAMIAGVLLAMWALPRLAERAGVAEGYALWLGALNPLVLFHLVSGAHNEALMVGLMLAGLELALRRRRILGALLITVAASVKIPAALALGFVGIALARRRGARWRDVAAAAGLMSVVFVAGTAAIGLGSGLGFGWIQALSTPNSIRSWISPANLLGLTAGSMGIRLGLGNHITAVLAVTQVVGLLIAAGICLRLLWLCLRGRMAPVAGTGLGLGAVVLLGPTLHPWYLLWASIPLSAAIASKRFRHSAVVLTLVFAVSTGPTGSGFDLRAWVLPLAISAAIAATLLLMWFTRRRVPPPYGRRRLPA